MDTVFDEKEFESFARALKEAPQRKAGKDFTLKVMMKINAIERRRKAKTWLAAAASIAACCSLFSMYKAAPSGEGARSISSKQLPGGYFVSGSTAPYLQAFAVKALANEKTPSPELEKAVAALARSQNAEGGWSDAALSARNVLALSAAASRGIAKARIAYRKGLKYLRKNGLGEMSVDEFAMQAKDAEMRLIASGNIDAARMVAMSARQNCR